MRASNMIKGIVRTSLLTAGGYFAVKKISQTLNKYQLNDKVVLITGGSRGLGIILARKLVDEGAKVVICGRKDESLVKASEDLDSYGKKHLAIPCDISDKDQVKNMISQIKKEFGSVDILINNAGIVQVGPMELMNEEDYRTAMDIHFWGPLYLIYEVFHDMKLKQNGRIVNISSIGGKVSFPHLLPYNSSKFALGGLSEGMAAELKKFNIKVTTVYPGLMRTGSPQNVLVKGRHEKEYAWFKIADSLPVLSIDADQVANQIIEAVKNGTSVISPSIPAKLAIAAHGIAPGLSIFIFRFINYLLPDKPEGDGNQTKRGHESESKFSTSKITEKTDEAAVRNLEKVE